MFAISFDMTVSSLEEHYGMPYNRAYYEIKEILKKNGFEWIQGSTYLTVNGNLSNLYKAINDLCKFDWFKKSVRDIFYSHIQPERIRHLTDCHML